VELHISVIPENHADPDRNYRLISSLTAEDTFILTIHELNQTVWSDTFAPISLLLNDLQETRPSAGRQTGLMTAARV
jgi:hypothetical protein